MLPIVNKEVEAAKSASSRERPQQTLPPIFRSSASFITLPSPSRSRGDHVYEMHSYAGDARVSTCNLNEERLISYATDLGHRGEGRGEITPHQLIAVNVVKGIVRVEQAAPETRLFKHPEDRSGTTPWC